MMLALRKRPVTTESVDLAMDRIEERLLTMGVREIATDRLGELVMEVEILQKERRAKRPLVGRRSSR